MCAICKVPTGVIRSRALQSLRDLNASQRWRAGDASSVKTSAGAGAAGASDTGKASVVSLWRLHESLARVYVEMRRDGVSGEQEVGAAGGVKRRGQQGSEASTGGDVRALFVSAVGKGAFARSAQGGASARTGGKGASAGSA